MKEIILYIFTLVLFEQISLGQNKVVPSKKVNEVDSVSQSIDSLISKRTFASFSISSMNTNDSSKYTRQYYFDSTNLCLVKCVLDTTFEDYNRTKFRQVIIYFYKGHEFYILWIDDKTSQIGFGSSAGDFLKDYKESGGIGKLEKGWTKQGIDGIMRQYIYRDISNGKFMQSRNFGN